MSGIAEKLLAAWEMAPEDEAPDARHNRLKRNILQVLKHAAVPLDEDTIGALMDTVDSVVIDLALIELALEGRVRGRVDEAGTVRWL